MGLDGYGWMDGSPGGVRHRATNGDNEWVWWTKCIQCIWWCLYMFLLLWSVIEKSAILGGQEILHKHLLAPYFASP